MKTKEKLACSPMIESRVREQLKLFGKSRLTDREILRRLEHYRNKIERAKRLTDPRGMYHYEDCLVMHEVYRRIAAERGIVEEKE